MHAITLSEVEEAGAPIPISSDLSTGARLVPASAVTRRIEMFIARRWTARTVTYIVHGPGIWGARLYPFTLTTSELWSETNAAYSVVMLRPSPLGGFDLDCAGPYRIIGTAGDDTVPPSDVREAVGRLAEYFAAMRENAGSAMMIEEAEGDYSTKRQANSAARAMQLSGAADLLRPYRHLGAT